MPDSKTVIAALVKTAPTKDVAEIATGTFPIGAKRCDVLLSREGWPDFGPGVPVVDVRAEVSHDNGATWKLFVGFQAAGGEAIDPATGKPITHSSVSRAYDLKGNPLPMRVLVKPLVAGVKIAMEAAVEDTATQVVGAR